MAVSDDVRQIEKEIDEQIAVLPLWRCARARVIRAALDYYREAIEVLMATGVAAIIEGDGDAVHVPLLIESRLRAGVFYVVKWALALCPEESTEALDDGMIASAQELGAHYEAVVDSLKLAEHGLAEIEVDRANRRITVYEGGEVTGADWALVDHQHRTNPLRAHVPLTADTDQLTSRWTAGDYRRTAAWLRVIAAEAQRETVMHAPPGAEAVPLFPRPVVMAVPEPPEPAVRAVLEDLTLTAEKLAGQGFWRYVSWLDTPIVAVGGDRLATSDALMALGGPAGDDHMLRLAVIVDPAQYTRVSGAREDRMIAVCRQILESLGWTVTPRLKLSNPAAEVDVYAVRGEERLVLQLKSTLRPETPWEVYKRNDDILVGIAQVDGVRARLGENVTVAVITDGYRGDYSTWRAALDHQVPIGTLEDLDAIARDPGQAFALLQQRIGFGREPEGEPPQERACELMGWSFRILDTRREERRG